MFGRGRGGGGRAPSFAALGRGLGRGGGPTTGRYNGAGRGTSSTNKQQQQSGGSAVTAMTDCFFFVTKGCTRGDGCAYRHCEQARLASKVG